MLPRRKSERALSLSFPLMPVPALLMLSCWECSLLFLAVLRVLLSIWYVGVFEDNQRRMLSRGECG